MAKRKQTAKKSPQELDSIYFLKMVFYLVIGSLWIRITNGSSEIPLPVGLAIGLILASHEKLQIDRKIEYAILIMAMFLGYWLPIGITISR